MKDEPENYGYVRGITGRALIINIMILVGLALLYRFGPAIWTALMR